MRLVYDPALQADIPKEKRLPPPTITSIPVMPLSGALARLLGDILSGEMYLCDNGADFAKVVLERGCDIEFQQGVFSILPPDGASLERFTRECKQLVKDTILAAMEQSAFHFGYYTAGRYGPKLAEGITLQFEEFGSDRNPFVNFNAMTTYLKKEGKKCHKSTEQVLRDGAWRMVWVVLYSN